MQTGSSFLCLILGLLMAANVSYSQTLTQTIRGTVVDAESKSPLSGATLLIAGTDPPVGGMTDTNGEFVIRQVPVGRQNLLVRYFGYEDRLIPEILVGSGKEVVLEIPLTEALVELEEVEIRAESSGSSPLNEMATVSSRSFSIEQTARFASSGFDPARLALSFAGVTAQNDLVNEIVIRGNTPNGLLWRLEGINIPNPNHLSGYGAGGGRGEYA